MGGPHQGGRVHFAGLAPEQASAAMVLVHGRGGSAADMLALAQELEHPGFAYLAPQAADFTWYPYGFMAPLEANEPGLSSGLAWLDELLADLADDGVPAERVVLVGFSQGACVALEYAARNARRYGGVAGLSGGLIGPPGTPRDYDGWFDGTPVFLGCSDVDPHVPAERVEETAAVIEGLGGQVEKRIYPGLGHTVNRDEIDAVREMMSALAGG